MLYTPIRGQFDQGNPEEYFEHQKRIITLDNLGMNLPGENSLFTRRRNDTIVRSFVEDENHQWIHRYGCSIARRQVQPNPAPSSIEIKGKEILSLPSNSNDRFFQMNLCIVSKKKNYL
jgi:hypothetical protein